MYSGCNGSFQYSYGFPIYKNPTNNQIICLQNKFIVLWWFMINMIRKIFEFGRKCCYKNNDIGNTIVNKLWFLNLLWYKLLSWILIISRILNNIKIFNKQNEVRYSFDNFKISCIHYPVDFQLLALQLMSLIVFIFYVQLRDPST